MIKIKDMEIGKRYTAPLVVISATARETKAKKPYLALELYDGTDKINSNYWDWGGKAIPDNNAILNVSAQVTEWLGTKQLNIKSLATNTDLHISDFTPSSGVNIGEVYLQAYSLADIITDDFLRSITLGILEDLVQLWTTAPGAKAVHHAYVGGTLIHCLSVAKIAKAIAEATEGAEVDLVVAGALLHDVGKLFGYSIDGLVCDLTDDGKLMEHTFLGANYVDKFASGLVCDIEKLTLLKHVILSHHGKVEYGAVITPACMEAHIVHHADAIDVAAEQIRAASGTAKWTDKIWALENRPHLSTSFLQEVFAQ